MPTRNIMFIGSITILLVSLVFPTQAQDNHLIYLPVILYQDETPVALPSVVPVHTQTPIPLPTSTQTPTPTSTPTATPTPASVWVVSSQGYRFDSKYFIAGEVINTSSVSVSGVIISARYYDAADQLVAVSDDIAFLGTTGVGQRNPFRVILSNAPTGIVRYTLSLRWDTGPGSYPPITVLSSQTRDNSGVEVFGEVRNDQAQPMSSVKVAATFYDSKGNVVRTNYSFITSFSLEPNESSVYTIRMFEDFVFTNHTVQAQGWIPPTATPTFTPTATPTFTPTATPTPTTSVEVVSSQGYRSDSSYFIVGEVINTSSIPVSGVIISARYYDAADQLVAVSDDTAFLETTSVGQRNPFRVILSNAPTDIVRYTLSLRWDTGPSSYQPITVLSSQTRDNSGVEVFGEVRNDQAQPMSFVKVAATFYDIKGNVVRTNYSYISSLALGPGESSVYTIRMFEDFVFTNHTVQAQGWMQ